MKKFLRQKRGNLLILVATIIALGGGIFAYQLFPNLSVVDKGLKEDQLSSALDQMRMAIMLERVSNAQSALFYQDWNTKANLVNYLKQLVTAGYLPKISTDPMIRADLWGEAAGQRYWLPTANFVASSGFQTNDLTKTKWALGSVKITAFTTNVGIWPGDALGGQGFSAVVMKQ